MKYARWVLASVILLIVAVGVLITLAPRQIYATNTENYSAPSDPATLGNWENRTPVKYVAASNTSDNDHVPDYICDGTADESEINSAINSVKTGGMVVLFNGTYHISFPNEVLLDNVINLTLVGRTENNVILQYAGDYCIYLGGDGLHTNIPVDNVLLENLTILQIAGTSDSERNGIQMAQGNSVVIRKVTVKHSNAVGIYVYASNVPSVRSSNIWIENCDVENTGNQGIAIATLGAGTFENFWILNNYVLNCGRDNTTGYMSLGHGILAYDTTNAIIANNTIENAGLGGIQLYSNLKNVENTLIQGNTIFGCGYLDNVDNGYAIYFEGSVGKLVHKTSVIGNNIYALNNHPKKGIYEANENVDNTLIENNIINVLIPLTLTGTNNTLINNTIPGSRTPHSPIYIDGDGQFDVAHGVNGGGDGSAGSPWIIENYVISAENATGIRIVDTDNYFIIRNCLVENGGSTYYGINLDNVTHGRIENNIVDNCSVGVYLNDGSSYNTIAKDNCSHNVNDGISLYGGDNNNVVDNNISSYNSVGIYLSAYSSHDNITNNVCDYNGDGIHLNTSDIANRIVGNTTENNTDTGIEIGTGSTGNTIYLNIILTNHIQENDVGGSNSWDNGSRGNYWSDWQSGNGGRYTLDNIVILPVRSIAGGTGENDRYPLVMAGAPLGWVTIFINGDTDFTFAHGVTSGTGTPTDPFIIENYPISASTGDAITIEHTTKCFLIRNCLLENGITTNSGIFLFDAMNGRIENNISRHNYVGVYLSSSDNNIIRKNKFDNNLTGISLYSISDNNLVDNNIVENENASAIYVASADITNASSYDNITNNVVRYNPQHAIYLRFADHINIVGNTVDNNQEDIFTADSSTYVYIAHNILSRPSITLSKSALCLENTSFSVIDNNTIFNAPEAGILFGADSVPANYDNIINNNIDNCNQGIRFVYSSSNNNVYNNHLDNQRQYGVYLESGSNYNRFAYNYLDNASDGQAGNAWDNQSQSRGNYWSDHQPPAYPSTNGIYTNASRLVGSGNYDNFPLVISGTPTYYTLSLGMVGTGTVSENGSGTYLVGDNVSLSATASAGWRFNHWSGAPINGVTENVTSIIMNDNYSINAVFTKTYTLTITVTGSATSPVAGAYTKDNMENVPLTATATSTWRFDHWTGNLSGSTTPTSIIMNGDKTVGSVFIKTYILTISVTGSGTVSPTTGSHDNNENVPITATASSGWRFDHWTGAASGTTSPTSVIMDNNKTVGAVFTATASEWPMFRHDTSATAYSTDNSPMDNHLLWRFAAEGNISPAIENGKIYVGANANLYCLNTSSGAIIWDYVTPDIVQSSPTVDNGRVYFGCDDDKIYSLNAISGALIWSYATGGNVYAAPLVDNGVVYIGSEDGIMYALNADNGGLIWSYAPQFLFQQKQIVGQAAISNGKLYFGRDYALFTCLNADNGSLIWAATDYQDTVDSGPLVLNSRVYYGTERGYLFCLNADNGSIIWALRQDNSYASWLFNSPVIVNGVLYLGDQQNRMCARNPDNGDLIWSYTMGAQGVSTVSASSNGLIYFGSQDGKVYALDNSGSLVWSYNTGSRITASPALADNKLYIAAANNMVYAFGAGQVYYNLYTSVTGSGSIAENTANPHPSGENVSITATAASGWHLSEWTGDLAGSATSTSLIMNSDKTIVAVFVQDTPTGGGGGGTPNPTPTTTPASTGGFPLWPIFIVAGAASYVLKQRKIAYVLIAIGVVLLIGAPHLTVQQVIG